MYEINNDTKIIRINTMVRDRWNHRCHVSTVNEAGYIPCNVEHRKTEFISYYYVSWLSL